MNISLIFAASENNVIGKNNQLPWHLPADLKFFKNTTTGHHIIMGRKTYESVGRPLPNRTNVIITRDAGYKAEGCVVVKSLDEALKVSAGDNEIFITGGGEIFKQAIHLANKIYFTKIHHSFEGDAFAPAIDYKIWKEAKREDFQPDEKNKYAYSFIEFVRI